MFSDWNRLELGTFQKHDFEDTYHALEFSQLPQSRLFVEAGVQSLHQPGIQVGKDIVLSPLDTKSVELLGEICAPQISASCSSPVCVFVI